MERIKAYLVYGFLDAGKTTYIQEQIFGGFFHKRGSTLILSFEDGEIGYDIRRLESFRTAVVQYDGEGDIAAFCAAALERFRPDRVYVEMNAMTEGLRDLLPDTLDAVFNVTLIDGITLPLYFANMRQMIQNMLADSHMAIFNRCADKSLLAPYSVPFRLINRRCDFLWQSEMGYSEKAFGRLLPYDITSASLDISDEDYPVFHLDCQERPDRYEGKTVSFDARISAREELPPGYLWLGRSVMTCCLADIQFLGFVCSASPDVSPGLREGDWIRVKASIRLTRDRYNAPAIRLDMMEILPIPQPAQAVIGLSPQK